MCWHVASLPPAGAQSSGEAPKEAPGPKLPKPKATPGPEPDGTAKGKQADTEAKEPKDAAKDPVRKLAESKPATPEEKERVLASLYALLATSETEDSALRIASAIERMWAASGSDTVQLLMDRAGKAIGDKNTALALKFLDSVVELAPDYAEGWNRRAYVHYTENAFERALGDIRRTLALDPNHFKALEGLGQIMKDVGRKPAAYKVFKQLQAVHPFASGVKQAVEELARELDGQGI